MTEVINNILQQDHCTLKARLWQRLDVITNLEIT